MGKVIPGCRVTFKHPSHGSTIQAHVCRVCPNGMILAKTRNAMWVLPMGALLSVTEGVRK